MIFPMHTRILFFAVLWLLLSFPVSLSAQSIEQIKERGDHYLWGEGTGNTLQEADKEALQMLISQISVQVESRFEHFVSEAESDEGDKKNYHFEERVKSVVNTYSQATLHSAERIVISNEPDAKVFRYIQREDVARVFEAREYKIIDFVDNARKAVRSNRIGDGLRYYYWAFALLKSHPDCNNLRYSDEKGDRHLLVNWIPARMDRLFSGLDFRVTGEEQKENLKQVILRVNYDGEPVTNLDYSYWDGRDWSNLVRVKDGRGILEYYGAAARQKEKGRVKVEYLYSSQANIDNELKTVMEEIEAVPFRNSYFELSFDKDRIVGSETQRGHSRGKFSEIENPTGYREVMNYVCRAIGREQYGSVREHFTRQGYQMYQKLIAYGKAQMLYEPDYSFYSFEDGVMVRSLPMSFSFKNNHQQFVEDVVFHFNQDRKIEGLSFGLSENALESIISKEVWDELDRMVLINFLEHYKTAYALKRLDYIQSIFAEDALIITGYVLKVKPNADSRYQDNKIVRYNRQSREEYIRNLRYSFNSKEYVNIQFEESQIRKGGKGGSIYGVQIKQNYYSSNYGDQGWLFLMVDLNDPVEPVIHVRTWQPARDDDVYGLANF